MKVSLSCPTLNLNKLDELQRAGFDGWEIVAEGYQQLNAKMLSVIQTVYECYRLEISVHTPISDLNIASLNQPIRHETIRQIKRCIAVASEFAAVFVVHPGYVSPLASHCLHKALEKNNAGLRVLSEYAKNFGVKLTVENMVNIDFLMGKFPEEIQSMMVGALGFTLDVGHANTAHAIDRFLTMKIDHVHVHDNNGSHDEHLILGLGNIDWQNVMQQLKKYKGSFVIEANHLEEGLVSLNYLRQFEAV